MGKINLDRKIHFGYEDSFIKWYKDCSKNFKDECAAVGSTTGFSSMNVAYVLYYQFILMVNIDGYIYKHFLNNH